MAIVDMACGFTMEFASPPETHRFAYDRAEERIDAFAARKVAEAVAAERERCAKIADGAVELVVTGHPVQFIPAEQYAADLARDIADAIRSGREP